MRQVNMSRTRIVQRSLCQRAVLYQLRQGGPLMLPTKCPLKRKAPRWSPGEAQIYALTEQSMNSKLQ